MQPEDRARLFLFFAQAFPALARPVGAGQNDDDETADDHYDFCQKGKEAAGNFEKRKKYPLRADHLQDHCRESQNEEQQTGYGPEIFIFHNVLLLNDDEGFPNHFATAETQDQSVFFYFLAIWRSLNSRDEALTLGCQICSA